MRVLVTGATGFIGTYLVKRLVAEGHTVRILKRPTSPLGDLEDLPLEIAAGDVVNSQSLVEACRSIDSVFHLAGYIAYSKVQRPSMQRINVDGTQYVVDACIANSVRKLIYMSSVSAIGASTSPNVLNEDSPFTIGHLDLGYFETKRQAEQIVLRAARSGNVDAFALNPSTVYGAGDAKKGSRGTQLKVAQSRFPFYPSGGVSVISIEDLINTTMVAWEKARAGERYIISGENLKIYDLFHLIASAAKVPAPKFYLPNMAVRCLGWTGDTFEALGKKFPLNSERAWTSILYHWFDNKKAKENFGLNPKPAAWAIENSVRWMRDTGLLDLTKK